MRGRGQAPGRAHCWRWGTCPTTSPLSGPPSVSPADGARSQRGMGAQARGLDAAWPSCWVYGPAGSGPPFMARMMPTTWP